MVCTKVVSPLEQGQARKLELETLTPATSKPVLEPCVKGHVITPFRRGEVEPSTKTRPPCLLLKLHTVSINMKSLRILYLF